MRSVRFLKVFSQKRPFAKFFSEEKNDLKSRLIKNSLLYVNKLGNSQKKKKNFIKFTGWSEKPIISACLDMDLSSVFFYFC